MKKLCQYIIFIFFILGNMALADNTYDELYNQVKALQSDAIMKMADKYVQKDSTDKAIVLYSVIHNRIKAEMTENEKQINAQSTLKLGDIYYELGNYTRSLDLYIKGLQLLETCDDKHLVAEFYKNIGNIYSVFQDYEKGMYYYEQGLESSKAQNNREVSYKILVNMSGTSSYMMEYEKAKKYYLEAEQLKNNKPIENFLTYYNWGLILLNEGKHMDAIQNFHQAINYSIDQNMEAKYTCSAYEEMNKTYYLLGNNDSTIRYAKYCVSLAEENEILHQFPQSLKTIYEIYNQKGDLKNTVYYQNKYLSLIDSIYNVRDFNQIKNVQYLFEIDKTTQKITSLQEDQVLREQKISQQKKTLLTALVFMVLILSLLVLLYFQKLKVKRSYYDLFNINRKLIDTQKQNRKKQEDYKLKLQSLEEQVSSLKMQLKSHDKSKESSTTATGYGRKKDIDHPGKYQSSVLTDEQKQVLIEGISNVMENTYEYCEMDFSLNKLADLLDSNSKYISQVINETYQKSFTNYVNDYRIREACIRLMDVKNYGHYTIKAISESLGYKSQTTFINVFRKQTGITPSVYQSLARKQV